MSDRKLLTADAKNLKAKVKAEMLRRCYSGSVSAYGGTAYDFLAPPADGGPVPGEHLKKNLLPMRAVNPQGLPEYPGELTAAGQAAMETKIDAWRTRGLTDRGASDCASGCTGTCFSGCQTGCYSGCSGCSGSCSGSCRGCSGSCSGGCTGCQGTCTGCSGTCEGACGNNCWGNCSGTCSGMDRH